MIRQQSKETKELRLREIYEKIRNDRKRLSPQHQLSQILKDKHQVQQHQFLSNSNSTISHKKALLNALDTYQKNNFHHTESEILQSWSEGNDRILSYYYQPIETLSMADISRYFNFRYKL